MSKNSMNRRDFLSSAAVMGAGTLGSGSLLASCGGKEPALIPLRAQTEWKLPADPLPEKAVDGVELKVGLVGCGRQGVGDLYRLLFAADSLKVTALGDMFIENIDSCRKTLKGHNKLVEAGKTQEIPDNMCFTGFDAYQKVIDAVDIVMLVTPPAFRPLHFKAAVDAGKHVFMEKPLAVDPVGARSILMAAKQADTQGLCVITGTQKHSQRIYTESYKQVQSGLIGEILSGNVYWNQTRLWSRDVEKGQKWTDMEWMIRDWINWCWLSGDHIVEQHIHNIDVFNWFSGLKPVKCVGFGARHRRPTGDQYDMFNVDYVYEGDVHLHSMCRQIDGCANLVSERIQGTKGVWNSSGVITDLKGNELWKYNTEKENEVFQQTDPIVLELANWINRIRTKTTINQAEETAISTLTAMMGRISAYTGAEVTWDQVMAMDMNLFPTDLSFKNMDMKQYAVPVPGKAKS